MTKASDKLAHLGTAVEASRDVAGTTVAKRRDKAALNAREEQMRHQILAGTDAKVVREVAAGTVPDETPETFALRATNEWDVQLSDNPDIEMDITRLRHLYITSTVTWYEFKKKYITRGAGVVEKIKIRERWDDQRVDFHEQRLNAVSKRFHEEMEDALAEHNQMHLELSMLIGNKIRSILPSITKPVEIQSCAVALKNIQSVSRLALGASTDNTALKGVDDFEEFLKGMKSKKENADE